MSPSDRRCPHRDQARRVPGRHHARRRARAAPPRRPRARAGRAPAPARPSPTSTTPGPAPRSSPTADEVWERADIVCKVKEPQASEYRLPPTRPRAVHLPAPGRLPGGGRRAPRAAAPPAIAYETVQLANGSLPLLAPMSEVAGRMSVQVGAHFLERHNGGSGVLLGGAPGVRPARVVVLGAGNVGWNAAWMAAGLEAEVDLLDKNVERLRMIDQIQMGRVTTLTSNRGLVERTVAEADLVIGAVLVAGGRAPVVVSEDMVQDHAAGIGDRRHRHRPGRVRRDLPRDLATTTRSSRSTASCTTRWATCPARCPTRRPTP